MSQKTELKELLDQSSGINRNLGLVFVSVLVYVLVAVAGTSDLMLLLPDDKPLTLPILQIELPVIPFYVVVPILVVGIHINLLINLHEHSIKLHAWLATKPEQSTDLTLSPDLTLPDGHPDTERRQQEQIQKYLHPFIFNYTAITGEGSLTRSLSRLLVKWVVFVLPLVVLLVIQIRLSDYHSFWLTTEHWLLFLTDMTIAAYFIRVVYQPHVDVKPVASDRGFFYFANTRRFFRTMGFCIGSLRIKNGATRLRPLYIGAVFVVGLYNYGLTCLVVGPWWYWANVMSPTSMIPKISLPNTTLVKSHPAKEWLYSQYRNDINIDSLAFAITEGLTLSNRDLRYAMFNGTQLSKVDLHNSRIDGASLDSTELNGANLSNTSMQGVTLISSVAIGCDFNHARANGANFALADLTGANLSSCSLKAANFFYTLLPGSELQYSNLSGSWFLYSQLQGALGWESTWSGAHISFPEVRSSIKLLENFDGAVVICPNHNILPHNEFSSIGKNTVNFFHKIRIYLPRNKVTSLLNTLKNKSSSTQLQLWNGNVDTLAFAHVRANLACNKALPIKQIFIPLGFANDRLSQLSNETVYNQICIECPTRLWQITNQFEKVYKLKRDPGFWSWCADNWYQWTK